MISQKQEGSPLAKIRGEYNVAHLASHDRARAKPQAAGRALIVVIVAYLTNRRPKLQHVD